MTKDAKDKAKQLINLFFNGDYKLAKVSALLCVNEIIEVLDKLRKPEYTTFIEWDQLKEKEEADTMDGYEYKEYFNQVKEAINSL